MLQILMGSERPAAPDDALGRAYVGWRPEMTEDEAWEAGRGCWKFKADRALAEDEVQIINTAGAILAVAKITGISKCGDRCAIEGDLLRGDPRVGRQIPTPHPSRNPVAYI